MAIRIDTAIIRGEINNEVRGQVTGKIWLVDREAPLVLRLHGNCHRDIAGCHLSFVNTLVRPQSVATSLATEQEGPVGDMTASRRVKVPTIPDEELPERIRRKEPIPTRMVNCLYIEWFSKANGRVVIEGTDFKIRISDSQWALAPDEEAEQLEENTRQMHGFIEKVARRLADSDASPGDADHLLDEFEWEERLKESDRITDAYMEALDKYRDDPDKEHAIARAMGWDAIADEAEAAVWDQDPDAVDADIDAETDYDDDEGADEDDEPSDLDDDEFFFGTDDDDLARDDHHPLYERVHSLAIRLTEQAQALGFMDAPEVSQSQPTPIHNLVFATMDLAAKLAGALNGLGSGLDPEPGLVIAWLKRGLPVMVRALSACEQARIEKRADAAWLLDIRGELFEVRARMLELIQEFRNQLP